MDKTIAPPRQPILADMFELLSSLKEDVVIVSGQEVDKIRWQSNNLVVTALGQNGNHAVNADGTELWNEKLSHEHRTEILDHISEVIEILEHDLNHDWNPIEEVILHRLILKWHMTLIERSVLQCLIKYPLLPKI